MKIRFASPTELVNRIEVPPGANRVSAPAVNDFSTVLLVGAGLATLVGLVWYVTFGVRPSVWVVPDWESVALGIGFMLVHEFIHLAMLPSEVRQIAAVGVFVQRAAAFVYFHGRLSRARSVLYLVAPFCALTVAPLLICAVIAGPNPELSFVALWNAFASSSDLMLAIAVLRETPRGAALYWGGPQLHWTR